MQSPNCLSAGFYIVVYPHYNWSNIGGGRSFVRSTVFPVWRLQVTTAALCCDAPVMRQARRCAMISPCQVPDYWSLHLLDFDWLKLYGSSAGFDWSPKSLNPTDWPLLMGYRWTIRAVSPTNRIILLVWMHLKALYSTHQCSSGQWLARNGVSYSVGTLLRRLSTEPTPES